MKTVRCLKLASPQKVSIDLASFEPSSKDCLIRVSVAAVCSTDIKAYLGQSTRLKIGYPPILGHEVYGVVSNPGSSGIPLGAKVAVIGTHFCLVCNECRRQRFLQCENFQIVAGGFSEEVLIPSEWCDWRIIHLKESIDPVVGAYFDTISCAYRALRISNIQEKEKLIICGGGFIACVLARLAIKASKALVTVIADSDLSISALSSLNISHYTWYEALNNADLSGDVVVDLSGRQEFTEFCGRRLRYGGRCIIMNGQSQADLPLAAIVYKKRIVILHSFHSDLSDREMVKNLLGYVEDVVHQLSQEFSFDEASKAFTAVASRQVMRAHLTF